MPDDKMRKDQAGQKGRDDKGHQSPGRNPQDDQSTGQRMPNKQPIHDESGGSGQGGQKGSHGQGGQRK